MQRGKASSLVVLLLGLAWSVSAELKFDTVAVNVAGGPRGLCATIGDTDSDGRNEVVVGSNADQVVRVLRLSASGAVVELASAPVAIPAGWGCTSLTVVDMDNDGDRDIALWLRANGPGGRLVVLTSQGETLTPATYATPDTDACYGAAIADVNGDALPDVVTCSVGWYTSTSAVFIAYNSLGPDKFTAFDTLDVPQDASVKTFVADFDLDGDADIGVASHPWGPNAGTLFLQRATGGFDPLPFAAGDGREAINLAFADLDGDGDQEMVTDSAIPHAHSDRVQIYGLHADGFPHSVSLLAGPDVYQPNVSDFNGDGLLDIAVNDRLDRRLRFYWGLPAGGIDAAGEVLGSAELSAISHWEGGIGDQQLSSGDVDGDGDVDLLLTTEGIVLIRNDGDLPDVTPPEIHQILASPAALWPPNGKLVKVVLEVLAADDVDPMPSSRIVAVTANEPIDASDWKVVGPLEVWLRAERAGGGIGRVYAITVECTDSSGNGSVATVQVVVPHDQR
jgi:hypothetical protein